MKMEAGVYKSETGTYGFLTPSGNFIPDISRDRARTLARENGLFTTFRGTYIPPKPTSTERPYRHYHWTEVPEGSIILTCNKDDYKNIREAARLFKKNNPTWDFSVTESNGTYTFRRESPGNGHVQRKTASYPWGKTWSVGEVMYTCPYKARIKVYAACHVYAKHHEGFAFKLVSDKANDTASFIRI
jgi:hypothetical protein